MSTDLDYCPYIDEYAEVFYAYEVRAAKRHVCCECGGGIEKGSIHEVISMLFDGQWDRYRTCRPCLIGPVAFVNRNCPGGRMVEGLFPHLEDVAHSTRSPFAEGLVMRWINEARVRRLAA